MGVTLFVNESRRSPGIPCSSRRLANPKQGVHHKMELVAKVKRDNKLEAKQSKLALMNTQVRLRQLICRS